MRDGDGSTRVGSMVAAACIVLGGTGTGCLAEPDFVIEPGIRIFNPSNAPRQEIEQEIFDFVERFGHRENLTGLTVELSPVLPRDVQGNPIMGWYDPTTGYAMVFADGRALCATAMVHEIYHHWLWRAYGDPDDQHHRSGWDAVDGC